MSKVLLICLCGIFLTILPINCEVDQRAFLDHFRVFFYRAMHIMISAVLPPYAVRSSVCPSASDVNVSWLDYLESSHMNYLRVFAPWNPNTGDLVLGGTSRME